MITRLDRHAPGIWRAGLLAIVGVMLLLANFGLLAERFGATLWLLWPTALAVLAVYKLGSRVRPWAGALAGLVLVVAMLIAAALLARSSLALVSPPPATAFRIPGNDAGAVDVRLEVGLGDARVTGGLQPPTAVDGMLRTELREALEAEGSLHDAQQRISLGSRGPTGLGEAIAWPPGASWHVRLSQSLPTTLELDAQFARVDADLSDTKVTRVDATLRLTAAVIELPSGPGTTEVNVEASFTTLQLHVPPNVVAEVRVEPTASWVVVDERRFANVEDGVYRSPEFAGAADRVVINLRSTASRVSVG